MKKKGILFTSLFLSIIMGASFIAQADGRIENTVMFTTKKLKNNKVLLEPADIFMIDSIDSYNALKNDEGDILPNVCLVKLNDSMNIIGKDGNVIESYLNAYNDVFLAKQIIPGVIIDDLDIFAKYTAFSDETLYVQDSYIVTSSLKILETIRLKKDTKYQNLCFDISNFDLNDTFTKQNLLYYGNKTGVSTYLIGNNTVNKNSYMDYFHARFKTTWLIANNSAEIAESIASGAYGVVNKDYKGFASVLDKFDEDGATRTQYVAAHRGITSGLYNENSTEAVQAAIDLKADFVEIDLQITKDNKIVVCHNSFPYYTTTCDSTSFRFIKNNYDTLANFTLNDQGIEKGLKIPLLSELFELSKDSDLKYLLEFKFDDGSADAYVADVAQYVDEIVKEYNMEDRVQGITFFKGFYTSINNHMPYMPTSYIGLSTDSEYKPINNVGGLLKFMKKYNTTADYAFSTNTQDYAYDYQARGYSLSGWTFTNTTHLYRPIQIATSDVVPTLAGLVRESADVSFKTISTGADLKAKMPINWLTYDGKIISKSSTITVLEGDPATSKYLTCVASVYDTPNDYGVYSKPFTISILGNGGSETEDRTYDEQENILILDSDNNLIVKNKNSGGGEGGDSSTSIVPPTTNDPTTGETSGGGNDNKSVDPLPIVLGIAIPVAVIGGVCGTIILLRRKKHKH